MGSSRGALQVPSARGSVPPLDMQFTQSYEMWVTHDVHPKSGTALLGSTLQGIHLPPSLPLILLSLHGPATHGPETCLPSCAVVGVEVQALQWTPDWDKAGSDRTL